MFETLPREGRLDWIGLRSAKRGEVLPVDSAIVTTAEGLTGDHYLAKEGKRQITLIQAEHLEVVASLLGIDSLDPARLRRNLVISGINLLALKNQRFRISEAVVLEMTGNCHPCTRMEEELGPGGYNAMRGHGGITAKVVSGGTIKVGDSVKLEIA